MTDTIKGFIFKWKIKNFSMLPHQEGECLESPKFMVDMWENTTWHLELYPRGDGTEDGKGFAAIGFKKTPKKVKFELNYTLTLESVRPFKSESVTEDTLLTGKGWLYPAFIEQTELYEKKHSFFPQDILTICFHLQPTNERFTEMAVSDEPGFSPNFWQKVHVFHSGIQVQQRSVIWPIQKVNMCKEHIEKSFTGVLKDSPGLKISLNFKEISYNNYVSIQIQQTCPVPLSNEQERLFVKCKLTIMSADEMYQDSKESTYLFKLAIDDIWYFPHFIEASKLKNGMYLKQDDTLHLRCEFTFSYLDAVYHWDTNYTPHTFETRKVHKKSDWSNSLQNLFTTGKFSDVELRAGDETFPSHRVVLCARSTVFSAMFENDMKEKRSGLVEIDDVDADTLNRMLAFMHSDIMDEDASPQDVCKLYQAADKYDIPSLKHQCLVLLISTLSVASVCDVLILAYMNQDTFLITAAQNFIGSHVNETLESSYWKNFKECNTKLAMEVLQEVLKNNK